MAYGQVLRGWNFGTPHPTSGPMSRAERDFWLSLIMQGSFYPPLPKRERRQVAYGAAGEPEREERSGTLIGRQVDGGGD